MLGGELLRLLEQHPVLAPRGDRLAQRSGPRATASSPGLGAALTHARGRSTRLAAIARGRRARGARPGAAPRRVRAPLWPALERELRGSLGGGLERLHLVDLAADFRLRDPALYPRPTGARTPRPKRSRASPTACRSSTATSSSAPRGRRAHRGPRLLRDGAAARGAARGARAARCAARALDPARRHRLERQRRRAQAGARTTRTATATCGPTRSAATATRPSSSRRSSRSASIARRSHFVPHSGPFARGIHLTAALPLARAASTRSARAAVFAEAYAGEPFVEVLAEGVPDLRWSWARTARRWPSACAATCCTCCSTLDNLSRAAPDRRCSASTSCSA